MLLPALWNYKYILQLCRKQINYAFSFKQREKYAGITYPQTGSLRRKSV